MPCNPNDNQINVDPPAPPVVPDFGIPVSPLQIPLPNWDLPVFLEPEFLTLIQKFSALFPSGTFNPIPNDAMRSALEFFSNVLTEISPYLSLYNFFLSLLKIIKCIIDILCAIPNPFAVGQKIIVLFTECIPPFLNLFPAFALVSIIISFLLLILALIEFIIQTLISLIESIVRNLQIYSDAIELTDYESVLAATQKIATLLCYLENILTVFTAITAIINIIKSLASFVGVTFCSTDDDNGCCPPVICPPFIKNTPDGISTTQGKLIYLSQIGLDSEKLFTDLGMDPIMASYFATPPIRQERWQVYDKNNNPLYKITDIITPVNPIIGDDFWAEEVNMSKDTSIRKAQYTVDMKLRVDPANFGINDLLGERTFKIKDCIVIEKPYIGTYQYDSEENNDSTRDQTQGTLGVLSIAGGKVYEILPDGTESEYYGGLTEQRTLNNFITIIDPDTGLPPTISAPTDVPSSDDSIIFDDIEFTWKPNASGLAGYNLTTYGCIPQVSFERDIINSIVVAEGIEPLIDRLPALPDTDATYQCISGAINIFRYNISVESAAEFQASALACIKSLESQTSSAICGSIIAGASAFASDFSLDTDIQVTTRPIIVSVALKDPSGTVLTKSLPESCSEISDSISASVTLGKVGSFTYDGSNFIAELTSARPGDGEITITFNNKVFSTYTAGVNGQPSSISEKVKQYTFVSAEAVSPVRRDETDVE